MDHGITLLAEGPFAGLPDYEPSMLASRDGARLSLVAMVEVRDQSGRGHMCKGLLTGQRFRLVADLPVGAHKVTILGGSVTHLRGPVLRVDSHAKVLVHRDKDLSNLFQLVETCSGLGGLGTGASHAGWKTSVHNDLMKSFCDHLNKFSGIEAIHGDVCKLSTVAAIHEKAPSAASMAFGFSCQPFSRLGDRREGQDPRSQSLPFSLYCAYLLQMDLVVTECVPEASQSSFVLKCMQQYMQATSSDRSEALLELSDVWPSKRRRWWTVMRKSHMGKVSIPPFPKLPVAPTVASLLPGLLQMSDQELQELTLSVDERKMFENYGKGLGGHMLNMNEPLATMLHSWANQCVNCACGCRGPLSCNRLQAQGLYGVLAHVPNQEPHRNVRHLSAREMAILVGFPKVEGWSDHQRLLTAGVGQVASPIQAAWIFAAILNHLIDHGFCDGPKIPPQQILACVAAEVFRLRDEWFSCQSTVTMDMFQETIEEFLKPAAVERPMAQVEDVTPSQDEDIAKAIDDIETKVRQGGVGRSVSVPAAESESTMSPRGIPSGVPMQPSAEASMASPKLDVASSVAETCVQHAPSNHAAGLVSHTSASPCNSHGPVDSKEGENSQRTGRKNPEAKISGKTNKQPACRTPEPDNQPAGGPQVPSAEVSPSVPVVPVSVGSEGVPGASSTQVSKSVTGPKGLPVGDVAPQKVPGLTVGSPATF